MFEAEYFLYLFLAFFLIGIPFNILSIAKLKKLGVQIESPLWHNSLSEVLLSVDKTDNFKNKKLVKFIVFMDRILLILQFMFFLTYVTLTI